MPAAHAVEATYDQVTGVSTVKCSLDLECSQHNQQVALTPGLPALAGCHQPHQVPAGVVLSVSA
jgi:hypothetical protein